MYLPPPIMSISSVPLWNFEPMYDQTPSIDVVFSNSEVIYPTPEKCEELITLLGAKTSAFDPPPPANRDISPFITDKFIDFFKFNPSLKIFYIETQSDQYHNVFAYKATNNRYYLIVFSLIGENYSIQEIEDHTILPIKNDCIEIDMPESPPVFRRSNTSDYDLLSSLDHINRSESNNSNPSIISTNEDTIELPQFCPMLKRTDNSFDTLLGYLPRSQFDNDPSSIPL
jgi:hypothetical protein